MLVFVDFSGFLGRSKIFLRNLRFPLDTLTVEAFNRPCEPDGPVHERGNQMFTLTDASRETFTVYAEDAANWSGNPWVSVGNICPTKEMRGNLGDLVKKGLINIQDCDGDRYVVFTDAGVQYAGTLGIDVTNF